MPGHLHALIAYFVYAGLRREEFFYLRWEDIRWKTKELTVASTRDHHTKNCESWRIPMNETIVQALLNHKREHIIVGSPYVFSNRDGMPYTDIREPLYAAARRAEIGDTAPNRNMPP